MGKLLHTIRPGIEAMTSASKDIKPSIGDCQYVASYNWLDEKASIILVPGTSPH